MRAIGVVGAVTCAMLLVSCGSAPEPAVPSSSPSGSGAGGGASLQGPYDVVSSVDGDTIRVMRDGEEIKVRFIGIDTPETVAQDRPIECFGPEASARTKELVEGTRVWLESDPVSGDTDKYGRTLAYVWLTPDVMLNELLVREGYAEEYTYQEGYRYQQLFRDAERAAQAEGAGMWSAC